MLSALINNRNTLQFESWRVLNINNLNNAANRKHVLNFIIIINMSQLIRHNNSLNDNHSDCIFFTSYPHPE